ncbi:ATP-binding cassette domain-containing protein [Secundilactobacillus mixtipabuli]|uniref:ABC transporter ATP-binding protein n=1 Tax=Secundilactobacillus mixtipabuli TaxID=1435342 RepID=A0A1Z5I8N5_9LACO|nr:ATP-binding cassette domain-containing protein [Secundilactobacillus mixtipabuli]GAW98119.1 ABC transporter ATP-binding protein [Secundilactobacillus mixtipabuli]
MTTTLKIENLTYRRNLKKILTDVSLTLSGDKIVGLLGENGAGKTTLMRLIAGVAKNAKGMVSVNEETALPTRKRLISFSNPLGGLSASLKITEVKSFCQRVYPDFDEQKYDQMSSFLNLDESQRLSALSKGTREKLVISLTLARQASVYLLDEPFSGIDSMSRKKIINSIIQWKPADSLMIISDHYVSEIAPILDEIVVIKDNTVAVHKAADAIREESGQSIEDYYESLYGEADSND